MPKRPTLARPQPDRERARCSPDAPLLVAGGCHHHGIGIGAIKRRRQTVTREQAAHFLAEIGLF
jgi:hypothetical protein